MDNELHDELASAIADGDSTIDDATARGGGDADLDEIALRLERFAHLADRLRDVAPPSPFLRETQIATALETLAKPAGSEAASNIIAPTLISSRRRTRRPAPLLLAAAASVAVVGVVAFLNRSTADTKTADLATNSDVATKSENSASFKSAADSAQAEAPRRAADAPAADAPTESATAESATAVVDLGTLADDKTLMKMIAASVAERARLDEGDGGSDASGGASPPTIATSTIATSARLPPGAEGCTSAATAVYRAIVDDRAIVVVDTPDGFVVIDSATCTSRPLG